MKKGLLLSIVASTFVFAGGDIYPVEPVTEVPAPAPVASCGDFSGSIGAYYETKDPIVGAAGNFIKGPYLANNKGTTTYEELLKAKDSKNDLFDTEVSKFDITAAVAMEKKFGYGITVGAEIAGWRDSHDIADSHRVSTGSFRGIGETQSHGGGEISQLWIAKSFGNTAIKVGRQALPKSLMPYAWTDTTAGVKDVTYEGIVFANTSLSNTTVYGL